MDYRHWCLNSFFLQWEVWQEDALHPQLAGTGWVCSCGPAANPRMHQRVSPHHGCMFSYCETTPGHRCKQPIDAHNFWLKQCYFVIHFTKWMSWEFNAYCLNSHTKTKLVLFYFAGMMSSSTGEGVWCKHWCVHTV